MKPLVSQLWPQFMADPDFAACFGQVIVEHARMLRQDRQVEFTLRSAAPLDQNLCARLLASLQPDYEGFELKIKNLFGYAMLDEHALRILLEDMKRDGVPINGFLDRSSITITGQNITVGVCHGTKFLQEMGFEELLAKRIAEHTGVTPKVTLQSAVTAAEQQQMEEKLERKIAPPVVKFEKKNTAPSIKVEGLNLTDKPVIIFHGKMFTPKNLTPLKDLGGEGGKCMIWGDVFFTEVKGNYRKIYTVSITDYTGSINLKVRAQEGEDCSKWEGIGKGSTVIVRGDCSYDKYEHDYIVYPYDVLIVERKKREDTAPEKRVELHLHTKLSSMDGFCDPGGIVKLAHRMGHPAIAITDHGVCQGYPEAMLAADDIHKKDPDFKLIYGCEAYFVDDMVPCVYGVKDQPLDGEFCVFDTETTGLDPGVEYLTEIGAVIIRNGEVVEEFDTFVKPGKPITPKITELTGITNEMVADAPGEKEALEAFLAFAGDRILVGHNVHAFDMRFLRAAAKRSGIKLEPTYIDTLTMAQTMYPGLHNYKQGTINKHLELPAYEAHRACEDSAALGRIFCVMLNDLAEKEVTKVSEINTGLGGNREVLKKKYYHLIILVKNQMGLKNLYKIVSEAHVNYFFKKPRVPRSLLNKYRDGLLLTSACEAGELYRAIVDGTSYEELKKIAAYYDILEIQPLGNNAYMVRDGKVDSEERIKEFNRTVIKLGEDLHKPVIATGDVHFTEPEDAIYRAVLQAGNGFKDADNQPPLFFRTTQDMLAQFYYLPKEKAYEVVVKNPRKIAAMIDNNVRAIPRGTYPPSIEGAEQQLRDATWEHAKRDYGDPLPEIVEKRLQKELDSICGHGYAVLYVIAVKLVAYSNAGGYQVGSRGSVGSSAVAHFSGSSEVNSLPPHYRCPKCKYSEFITDGSVDDGFDLPDKNCPHCGTRMLVDGHDIPFETFLGFYGDKEPDIDLNFSGEYQSKAHKYTEVIFGAGQTFRAGTIATLADKTAFGYVKNYFEERGIHKRTSEIDRIASGCTGVRRSTGQHPGGIVVLPLGQDINSFTPVQHPANDMTTDTITTHFDYHSIDHNLLKLDILGHDDPTMIRMLQDLTGRDPLTIPLDGQDVMSLFQNTDALGITPEQIGGTKLGALGIPEFGTDFAMQMVIDAKPKAFSDLVRISGLSHGTNVWLGNAQDLIMSGVATISTAICTRDDIMLYLIQMGVESEKSFKIMEAVRKGMVAKGKCAMWEEWKADMLAHDVPQWYIESCQKIEYMFPKAHAAAYVMMAWRIAYCKIHYPLAYYGAFFSIRAKAFSYEIMCQGQRHLESVMAEYKKRQDTLSNKEKDAMGDMRIVQEMYARGFEFEPIDIFRAQSRSFQIVDGKLMPSLNSIDGLGEKAADAIVEAAKDGPFLSKDDFRQRTKVSKTIIDLMDSLGLLGDLPESNQISIFDLV